MKFKSLPASEVRKNFSSHIQDVDEKGDIIVLTIHGKSKVAMIDLDLLEEFIENTEYGISSAELKQRLKEKPLSLDDFKKKINYA